MSDNSYRIRRLLLSDMPLLFEWCSKEGWNPGLGEGPAYFALDADGLWIAESEGKPIASVFGVRTGEALGHVGAYLVIPTHRGKGLGLPLFEKALARISDRTVALEGVLAQQDNYRKQGFQTIAPSFRLRYEHESKPVEPTCDLLPIAQIPMSDVAQLDHDVFGANRPAFWTEWFRLPESRGLAAVDRSRLVGFGHVRRTHSGWRVGPLVADSVATASELLAALCEQVRTTSVELDVCTANSQFEGFARHLALKPVFETARMYRGTVPDLNWSMHFAMSAMEIG